MYYNFQQLEYVKKHYAHRSINQGYEGESQSTFRFGTSIVQRNFIDKVNNLNGINKNNFNKQGNHFKKSLPNTLNLQGILF